MSALDLIEKYLIKKVYKNDIIQSLFLMGKCLGHQPAKVIISLLPEFESPEELSNLIIHQLELPNNTIVDFDKYAYPFIISIYKEFLMDWLEALEPIPHPVVDSNFFLTEN